VTRTTRSLIAAIAAIAAFAVAAPAALAQAGAPGAGGGERGPSGLLHATGSGHAVVVGRVTLSGNLPRRSVLRVIDRAGDASVHVAGVRVPLRKRRALLRRASGIVFASGSDVTLHLTGTGMDLSAAGVGRATLRGTGRYRLNLAAERAWPQGAIRLAQPQSHRSPSRSGAPPRPGPRR
jgi:hypothetical protein